MLPQTCNSVVCFSCVLLLYTNLPLFSHPSSPAGANLEGETHPSSRTLVRARFAETPCPSLFKYKRIREEGCCRTGRESRRELVDHPRYCPLLSFGQLAMPRKMLSTALPGRQWLNEECLHCSLSSVPAANKRRRTEPAATCAVLRPLLSNSAGRGLPGLASNPSVFTGLKTIPYQALSASMKKVVAVIRCAGD